MTHTSTASASPLTVESLTGPQTRWRRLVPWVLVTLNTLKARSHRSPCRRVPSRLYCGPRGRRICKEARCDEVYVMGELRWTTCKMHHNIGYGCFAAALTRGKRETTGSQSGSRTPVRCLSPIRLSRAAAPGADACSSGFQRSGTDGCASPARPPDFEHRGCNTNVSHRDPGNFPGSRL